MRVARARLAALAVGAGLLLPAPGGAVEDDAHLWAVGSVSAPLSDRLRASLMVQGRFADDMSEPDRVVVRPSLRVGLAEGLSGSLGYDAHVIELLRDRLEQRAWQQLAISRRVLEAFDAGLRLRLEQRFLEDVDGVAVRGRARLRVVQTLRDSVWHRALSNETFVGFNGLRRGPDSGFDENRLFAGVGRPLGPGLRLELGYQMRYLELPRRDAIHHTLLLSVSLAPP